MNNKPISTRARLGARCAGAILGAFLALAAAGQDDQKLVLDDSDVRSLYYSEKELDAKSQALEAVKTRLEQMERDAQNLEQSAGERQRAVDEARSALTERKNSAELAQQTVEANLARIEGLKLLLKAFQDEKREAANALERRLALLQAAKSVFDEVPFDPGDPAGPVHRAAWRAAAQHAAYRFAQAQEAIRRTEEDLGAAQAVVLRQQSLSGRSASEAQALEQEIAQAEKDLEEIHRQRQERQESIPLLRSRQQTLQDLVSHLAEQERLYQLRGAQQKDQGEAGQSGDQRLIAGESEAPPRPGSPTLPLSDSPPPAGGEIPGFEVETGDSQAIHAAVGGEILYAGPLRYYDQIVILNHNDGYFSVYAYLKRLFVAKGERVSRGDVIGLSGPLPSADGRHGARFEVRRGETAVDPASWPKTPSDLRRALVEGIFAGD